LNDPKITQKKRKRKKKKKKALLKLLVPPPWHPLQIAKHIYILTWVRKLAKASKLNIFFFWKKKEKKKGGVLVYTGQSWEPMRYRLSSFSSHGRHLRLNNFILFYFFKKSILINVEKRRGGLDSRLSSFLSHGRHLRLNNYFIDDHI
jgi:hypothetical protein